MGSLVGWHCGGVKLGAQIADPHAFALDVFMIAFFSALLTGSWKGKATFLPWTIAALVSLIAYLWGPENWHVVAGGIAGGIVGGFKNVD